LKTADEIVVGDVISGFGSFRLNHAKITKIEKFDMNPELKFWFGREGHEIFKWCSRSEEFVVD
jgi:hypothetical protein